MPPIHSLNNFKRINRGNVQKPTQFSAIFTFLAHFRHFFSQFSGGRGAVIVVSKMLERSPITFNSTRTSDSGKTGSKTVTNCYPECIKTHHFDMKIQNIFWAPKSHPQWGRGHPSRHPTPLGAFDALIDLWPPN